MQEERRFPSPFDVKIPVKTEDWQGLYTYFDFFCEERREHEEKGRIWFWDSLHFPYPLTPFETTFTNMWWVSCPQYNSRIFATPPAKGLEHRILGGYLYVGPTAIEDPKEIEERVAVFQKRAGFYYQNWDELYKKWVKKITALIDQTENIEVKDLPTPYEDEAVVFEARGVSSAHVLWSNYRKCIENFFLAWQIHFEFLNICYAGFLTFLGLCKQLFPDITEQTVTRMVQGIDPALFRPDAELVNLAKMAREQGVAGLFKKDLTPEDLLARMAESEGGKKWLNYFESIKKPWFYVSSGTNFSHNDISWIDDLSIPFSMIRGYIEALDRGKEIGRNLEKVRAERDQITKEYRSLIKTEEERAPFDQLLALAQNAFPYTENHIFYVEHFFHTVFWRKMREFGRLLHKHNYLKDPEDMWFLKRGELDDVIYELCIEWANRAPARAPHYIQELIERRKEVYSKLEKWTPPLALGVPPDVITEPFTIMLWGVTSETINSWLKHEAGGIEETKELRGFGASPGIVEGVARVISDIAHLKEVMPDDILVCKATSPSWAPIFGLIKATVSDLGGIMCHAAIVCREYGLPAVVGTGYATTTIKTGDKLRVDGTTGVVTILD